MKTSTWQELSEEINTEAAAIDANLTGRMHKLRTPGKWAICKPCWIELISFYRMNC